MNLAIWVVIQDYINYFITVGRSLSCTFSDSYICGYATEGNMFVWAQVNGLAVKDGVGPTSDYMGSVLGKMYTGGHYNDVIMSAMASEITSLTIV